MHSNYLGCYGNFNFFNYFFSDAQPDDEDASRKENAELGTSCH